MTKIMGQAVATAEQMAGYLLSVNPLPQISIPVLELCRLFLSECAKEGVRGDLEFARSCKETGNFTFKGTVKPEQNNYAGLGTLNADTQGAYFATPDLGILAQAQHAKGYATREDLNCACVDPRYELLFKYGKAGTAPAIEQHGGKWAVPGYDVKKYASLEAANEAEDSYGYQVKDILDKILNTEVKQMEIRQCIFTKNRCYKAGKTIVPKGIVVHSTGANNPNLCRYVQPDDGILGKNKYNNHWNNALKAVCVHAFIGKDKNGNVRVYQILPWNRRSWGCGSGKKGTYNDSYIQIEICEDALNDPEYFSEAFALAADLCAYLCKLYNIPVSKVVSHKEAYAQGYASNHGDCDHWLAKFDKNMDWFRAEVSARSGAVTTQKAESKVTTTVKVDLDYSLVFDAAYYANRYADLKAAFGTDEKRLLDHFMTYGMREGRQAKATFNVLVYKARYKDLQAAFGGDLPKYYEHYIQFGYAEGRKAV